MFLLRFRHSRVPHRDDVVILKTRGRGVFAVACRKGINPLLLLFAGKLLTQPNTKTNASAGDDEQLAHNAGDVVGEACFINLVRAPSLRSCPTCVCSLYGRVYIGRTLNFPTWSTRPVSANPALCVSRGVCVRAYACSFSDAS